MIIRKKINSKENSSSTNKTNKNKISAKGNIIKKEDFEKEQKQFDDFHAVEEKFSKENTPKRKPQELEPFEKIDISSIEFKERMERRRGERRRGYRRIDERSLVSRAQQEAHSINELAAREGYQNGLKKAQNELEDIKSSLSEILSMRKEMYEEFFPHIMEISINVAQKIIKKEVELSSEILKNVALAAFEEINSDAERVTIKVNPDEVEFAKASLPEEIKAKGFSAKVNVVAEDIIEKGSCVVIVNNGGVVDANFKTQLAVLQNAFGIYQGGI